MEQSQALAALDKTSKLTSRMRVLGWQGAIALTVAMMLGACGGSSAPKAPAKQGADAGTGTHTGGGADGAGAGTGTAGATALDVDADPSASLSGTVGTALSLTFKLVGDGGKDIGVGLLEAPSGMTASTSGTTITVAWPAPTAGSKEIKFLLRDMQRCIAAQSAADCKVDGVSPTALKVGEFDVTSKAFTVSIAAGTSTSSSTATGTGTGTNSKSGLIGTIQSLLGGAGGGGGGGLSSILQGLGTGQLQDILGQLTGGGTGGGFDISSLLGGLGGTNLTDPNATNPTP